MLSGRTLRAHAGAWIIARPRPLSPLRCWMSTRISYLNNRAQRLDPGSPARLMGNRGVRLRRTANMVCRGIALPNRPASGLQPEARTGSARLVSLFRWDDRLLSNTKLAIRRLGHRRWLRNLALGWGTPLAVPGHQALKSACNTPSPPGFVEHVSPGR